MCAIKHLEFMDCSAQVVYDLIKLVGATNLERVVIKDKCYKFMYTGKFNMKIFEGCVNLKHLIIESFELYEMASISKCSKLKHLEMSECRMCEGENVEVLVGLRELRVFWPPRTHLGRWKVSIFDKLKKLRKFQLTSDYSEWDIMYFGKNCFKNVTHVELYTGYNTLGDLCGLDRCRRLRHITIKSINYELVDVDVFGRCENLRSITLCSLHDRINFLKMCKKLTHFCINACSDRIPNLEFLSECNILESVILRNSEISDVYGLSGCANLREFKVYRIRAGTNVNLLDLNRCSKLNNVVLFGLNLRSAQVLNGCAMLRRCELEECRYVNLLGLVNCGNLEELRVCKCNDLETIEDLRGCSKLRRCELIDCENLTYVSRIGFGGCPMLKYVRIVGCPKVAHLMHVGGVMIVKV